MSENSITILNRLIETSKDGEKGFRQAAEYTPDHYLQSIFNGCADSYQRAVNELQTCVAQLGAQPEDSGSVLGALHRGWTGIKATLSRGDSHAILVECERVEESVKDNYLKALNAALPTNIHLLIERQCNEVVKNHNIIRELRDKYAERA